MPDTLSYIGAHNLNPGYYPTLVHPSFQSTTTTRKPQKSRSDLEAEIRQLQEERAVLKDELDATKMHARVARLEAEEAQQRLNAKASRKSAKATVTAPSGWLTSVHGKELHQEQEAVCAEKKHKKAESAAKKVHKVQDKQKC